MKARQMRRPNKIVQDIHVLRDDLARLYTDLTQSGRRRASATRNKLGSMANDGLHRVEQKLKDARDSGRQAIGKVQHRVEENPVTSLLIAFGVGFVLGKVFLRR
jgi:ElaB/YqjD/DUF883 family membrane-anchored ribosome-binding protein